MEKNYLHYYRILGISPDCSPEDLKKTYRRLARKWHPDRFVTPQGTKDKRLAEERIKEVNHAYWSLSDYHRKFGHLPLEPTKPVAHVPDDVITEHASYRASTDDASFRRLLLSGIMITGVSLGLIFTILYFQTESEIKDVPTFQVSRENGFALKKDSFSVGSKPGDVYAAQGIPTKTEKDVWYYGSSRVYFNNGVVTHWVSDPGFPLRVSSIGDANKDFTPLANKYIAVGSTKEEVRAIQGTPLRETDSLWEYRISRVYFEKDRVKGWYSSPLDPLRVRNQ